MKIELLPDDIWICIASNLSVPDLFNLRLVSKSIGSIINSRRVWSHLCYTNWLQYEIDAPTINDYQEYFFDRYRVDNQITSLLTKICSSKDSKIQDQLIKQLLTFHSTAKPLLIRISSKVQYKNLRLNYYSRNLLNAVRFKVGLDYIHSILKNCRITDYEDFFFKLSHLDRSFDKLLPSRSEILRKTIKDYKEYEVLNNIPNNTTKILKLYSIFRSSVNSNPYTARNSSYFTEDFFILRVYNGEITGHPYLLYAILNKLSNKLKIKNTITRNALVIEDDTYPNGKSFLVIDGTVKVYTEIQVNKLLSSMNLQFGQRSSFFSEVTTHDLIAFWLDIQRYKSVKTLSYNNVKLFPKSQYGVDPVEIFFISIIFKCFQFKFRENNTEIINDSFLKFMNESQLKQNLKLNNFFLNYFIQDYFPHLKVEDVHQELMNYKGILEAFNISYSPLSACMDIKQNKYEVGDLIYNERLGNYSVILGIKQHQVLRIDNSQTPQDEIYYNCLTLKKSFEIYNEEQITKLSFNSDNITLFKKLIWNFGRYDDLIGFFFDGVDFDNFRFIPREELQELFNPTEVSLS